MDHSNSTDAGLRVDGIIDEVVARRMTGPDTTSGVTESGGQEALIAELASLGAVDWPPDEAEDRIAMGAVAAVRKRVPAARADGPRQHRPARRAPARSSRWLVACAAVAAAALVVVGLQAFGSRPGAGNGAGGSIRHQVTKPKNAVSTSPGRTPALLTAMTVVSRTGALAAVGMVANGDSFLTCVTSTTCYIQGYTRGGNGTDVARSDNGGASWTAGEPLPALPSASVDWNAPLSCPTSRTCYSAYGRGLLQTRDGFAHYRLEPVNLPAGMPGQLYTADQVSCPTNQHCVAAITLTDNSQRLIYSDNGGTSWASAAAPVFTANYTDVMQLQCGRHGACIAALSGGDEERPTVAALGSTNGGRSWTMSATYVDPELQTVATSCGDEYNCLVGGGNRTSHLAWLHLSASGRVFVRVVPFPKSWATTGITVSCATGRDCFVETEGTGGPGYNGAVLEATRDGGRTWISAPMAPSVPSDIAAYLSCPVVAGCIAIAQDPRYSQPRWVVLSNLRQSG